MSTNQLISRQAFPRAGAGRFPRSPSPVQPGEQVEGYESAERLAGFLGWFSVGLGLTQLLTPRGVARFIGARGDTADCAVMRLIGLQELTVGLGILTSRRPTGWIWARVAGDVAHLSMLGTAIASGPPRPDQMMATTAAIAGITALDAFNALQLSEQAGTTDAGMGILGPVTTHQAITIGRPAEELYRFWRDFRNLPRIMSHLEAVEVTGEKTSHWKAKAPAGMTVEWDVEITEERPNERIAWRSTGGHVDNAGSVRFVPAPGGRGTEVRVELHYRPPGGIVGRWFAKLFGEEPEQQVFDDLRHFKQVMETGEVVLSDSSFDGSRLKQRPAQPPESAARW